MLVDGKDVLKGAQNMIGDWTGLSIRKKGINQDHLIGVAVGMGVAAVAMYLYMRNQSKIESFLREQGIQTKKLVDNVVDMTADELTEMKEHLEDLIAEKTEEAKELKKAAEKAVKDAKENNKEDKEDK